MKIGLIPNIKRESVVETLQELFRFKNENIEFIIDNNFQSEISKSEFIFDEIEKADIVITLGGDGTLIKATHKCALHNIPILGINLGNLGFLTEGGKDDIMDAVKRLERNDFIIEERMMLEVRLIKGNSVIEKYFALNDAVLARKALSRMVQVTVSVNELLLDDYYADGIIISTPTGSTGYSLSAGGPIIEPSMKMMIITPICPHSLNSRPVIISNKKIITLQPSIHKECETALTIDGQTNIAIEEDMKIEISQASFTTKLVKFNPENYFETIRKKLFKR